MGTGYDIVALGDLERSEVATALAELFSVARHEVVMATFDDGESPTGTTSASAASSSRGTGTRTGRSASTRSMTFRCRPANGT
ncbi:hypothetical protein GXW82_42910 [Streptacidiphilus sp. 4-A2]|nr:hypothetical protein [Streptacidiphilus sp. 4-A2]